MRLLVSICNKKRGPEETDPGIFLYEVDVRNGQTEPVRIDHPDIGLPGGVTGLTRYGDGFAVVTQDNPPRLVFLDDRYRGSILPGRCPWSTTRTP